MNAAVVLAFCGIHAIVLAIVAGPVSRPLILPYAIAALAGVTLFVTDWFVLRSRSPSRDRSLGSRAMRWGVWLMGAASVLGVANVWYATLDPIRPVLPSVGTFTASLVVAGVFIVMAATTHSDSS